VSRARSILALAIVVGSLVSSIAHAEAQDPQARVELHLEGGWPRELSDDVVQSFEASVEERGIDVVVRRDGLEVPPVSDDAALAVVVISAPSVDAPTSTITVRDRLTRKVVERVVPLGAEPVDVWSVLLAGAADELLRASWIELSMPDAPPPSAAVPAVVSDVVARSIDPPIPSDPPWGVALEAELAASEGALFLGGRVALANASLDPLLIGIGVGALGLLPRTSDRARFEGVLAFADLDLRLSLLPRRGEARLAIVGLARAGALYVSASASEGFRGSSDVIPTVAVLGGLRGGLALGPGTQIVLGLLVGAPVLAVAASDGASDVVSLSGPMVIVDLGVEIWP
jgi:hypothetical protein